MGTPLHPNRGPPVPRRGARRLSPGRSQGPGRCQFPPHVREGLGAGEPSVRHHRPQRQKTRVGEEQPGRPGRRLQAHEAALEQAQGDGRHLGLAGLRAAAPGPELDAIGDAGQSREELVELAADVVPLAGREDGGRGRQGCVHGGSIAPRAACILRRKPATDSEEFQPPLRGRAAARFASSHPSTARWLSSDPGERHARPETADASGSRAPGAVVWFADRVRTATIQRWGNSGRCPAGVLESGPVLVIGLPGVADRRGNAIPPLQPRLPRRASRQGRAPRH